MEIHSPGEFKYLIDDMKCEQIKTIKIHIYVSTYTVRTRPGIQTFCQWDIEIFDIAKLDLGTQDEIMQFGKIPLDKKDVWERYCFI